MALHPRHDPARRCRPPQEWPADDRAAWLEAQRPGDVLDPAGPASGWSPYTRRRTEHGYGRYLTWLDGEGLLDPLETAARRITLQHVVAYIQALQHLNASQTVLSRVHELEMFLAAIAPTEDRAFLKRLAARLRPDVQGVRNKRQRLHPSRELLTLGCRLMQQAEAGLTARQQAIRFRDGLMIALLAARPLRRKNFTALEIGRHLVRQGDGWWLVVPSEETKAGAPIEIPFPEALVQPLERYLAVHRPLLAGLRSRWWAPAGHALWVSAHGSPMTEIAIHFRIMQMTEEAFGHVVNMHLFRDCAATSIAIEDPVHVRIAAQILGHQSFATTEKYYRLARATDASLAYQAALNALR